jgi:hypothetical protein
VTSFHIEIQDGRSVVRAFNLSSEQVTKEIINPLKAGQVFSYKDKDFTPRKTRLIVIEGDRLGAGELGIGQGWTNAVKRGSDVTQRFLTDPTAAPAQVAVNLEAAGRLKERILGRLAGGPLPLGEGLGLTADLLRGHRVSERLSAVETAVWEMLHHGQIALHANADEGPLESDQWEEIVLEPASWLASRPDSPVISAIA